MKEFQIVTISNRVPTEDYYCLSQWYKSVEGYEPLVIGSAGTPYTGLCDKAKFVYRAIKGGHIRAKYILFSDSWDLVYAAKPEEVIDRYLEFNADLVISSEKTCFPEDLKANYDKLPFTSSYKYLNSGMIVGRTDSLYTTLEAMEVEDIPDDYFDEVKRCNVHFNDQFEYQKIFLKQPVNIKLDYNQTIANSLHAVGIDELDFSEARIKNIETTSKPCVFHLNGGAKTGGLREPILNHLGL